MNQTASPFALPIRLAGLIQEQLTRWTVPGLTIGLLRDGQIGTWSVGVASLETQALVQPDSLFQVGSISKVFTATLVMQLVDEGLLDLDTPVVRYLPWLKLADVAARERITMRHLLSHTAGFYGDRFEDHGPADDALLRAVAEFDTLRQWTPPGESWAYSNTGFQLAGAVVQQLRGAPFEVVARERLLQPLGLNHTFYFAHEAITYPLAVGHNTDADGVTAVAHAWARPRSRSPQGGVISTVGDLLRFAAFHMGDGRAGSGERVLSPESIALMQQPQSVAACFADHYGFGWALRAAGDTRTVGHGGTTNGYRARLQLLPERGLALALLTNGGNGVPVNDAIENWWLGHEAGLHRPEPVVTTLSTAELDRVCGRYSRPENETTVSAFDGKLRFDVEKIDAFTKERTSLPPSIAVPINANLFAGIEGEASGETIDFLGDDGGVPRFLRMHGRLADRIA